MVRIEKIADPYAISRHLIRVTGAYSPAGGANLFVAFFAFGKLIQLLMIGKDKVCYFADAEVVVYFNVFVS